MTEPTVLYEERGAVAIATLNRPQALNSFTRQMHRELGAAMGHVEANPALRAFVMSPVPAAASAPGPTCRSSTLRPGRIWSSAPIPAR
jgi:enoyl-CoA hydratase/carnithine racemase